MTMTTRLRMLLGASVLLAAMAAVPCANAQSSAAELRAKCKANPAACEKVSGAAQTVSDECAANPEKCDQVKATGQAAQDQCAANPEACQEGKDAVRGRVTAAQAKGQDYCAQNPGACEDAADSVDTAKETCTDPAACDELKTDAANSARDRLRARKDAATPNH